MPDKIIKMGVKQYLSLTKTKVTLISLAHGVNDMYASFLPIFIPFIRENLGLSGIPSSHGVAYLSDLTVQNAKKGNVGMGNL